MQVKLKFIELELLFSEALVDEETCHVCRSCKRTFWSHLLALLLRCTWKFIKRLQSKDWHVCYQVLISMKYDQTSSIAVLLGSISGLRYISILILCTTNLCGVQCPREKNPCHECFEDEAMLMYDYNQVFWSYSLLLTLLPKLKVQVSNAEWWAAIQ